MESTLAVFLRQLWWLSWRRSLHLMMRYNNSDEDAWVFARFLCNRCVNKCCKLCNLFFNDVWLWYHLIIDNVMGFSRGLSHYNLYLWIFPSRKIKIVLGGIRAILDPRTRPVEPNTSLEAKQSVCYRVTDANSLLPPPPWILVLTEPHFGKLTCRNSLPTYRPR
jgi:hypothetical protein